MYDGHFIPSIFIIFYIHCKYSNAKYVFKNWLNKEFFHFQTCNISFEISLLFLATFTGQLTLEIVYNGCVAKVALKLVTVVYSNVKDVRCTILAVFI